MYERSCTYLATMIAQPYLARIPRVATLFKRKKIPWNIYSLELAGELDLERKELEAELRQRYPYSYTARLEWKNAQKKDLSKLREPIHFQFVNWESTPEGVVRFTRRFGLVWDRTFDFEDWVKCQVKLREYWKWNNSHSRLTSLISALTKGLAPVMYPVMTGSDYTDPMSFDVDYEPTLVLSKKGPRIVPTLTPQNLWQYILIQLMEEPLGRLRVCKNPDCFTPYFIARRKDQVYCGSDCASLVAKRNWWNEHGREWRRKRKKKTR